MDEIARDLRISKTTLYSYFETKETLFCAVLEQEQHQFIRDVQPILQENISAGAKLTRYAEYRFHYFREMVSIGQFTYPTMIEMKPLLHEVFAKFDIIEKGIVEEIISKGVTSKEFTQQEPRKCSELFFNILLGLRLNRIKQISLHQNKEKELNKLEDEFNYFMTIFLRGIGAGSQQPVRKANAR
jgi:TetR/AcrR family transcriptional repressor of mexJK operon